MSKSKSGFVKKLGYRSRPESPRVAGLNMRYFLTDTGEERIVVYTLGGREDWLEVDYTVDVEHKEIIDKLNEIIDILNAMKGE